MVWTLAVIAQSFTCFIKTHKVEVGTECYVSGWGRTELDRPSKELRAVKTGILEDHICIDEYGQWTEDTNGYGYNEKLEMCVGPPNKIACGGDSGKYFTISLMKTFLD